MRGRLLNLSAVARAAGFALVAVAIVATAVHLGRDDATPRRTVGAVAPRTDPLAREMNRCEALGMVAEQDAGCQAAWTENRRRFFTYRPADGGARTPGRDGPAAPQSEDR